MIVEIFDHHEYDQKPELIMRYKPVSNSFKVLEVKNYLIIRQVRYQIESIEFNYDTDTLGVYCKRCF